MCQWILQPSGEVIARSIVCMLTISELNSNVDAEKQRIFLRILHKRVGISQTLVGIGAPLNRKANAEPYEND